MFHFYFIKCLFSIICSHFHSVVPSTLFIFCSFTSVYFLSNNVCYKTFFTLFNVFRNAFIIFRGKGDNFVEFIFLKTFIVIFLSSIICYCNNTNNNTSPIILWTTVANSYNISSNKLYSVDWMYLDFLFLQIKFFFFVMCYTHTNTIRICCIFKYKLKVLLSLHFLAMY